jgi:hypothetical protein
MMISRRWESDAWIASQDDVHIEGSAMSRGWKAGGEGQLD